MFTRMTAVLIALFVLGLPVHAEGIDTKKFVEEFDLKYHYPKTAGLQELSCKITCQEMNNDLEIRFGGGDIDMVAELAWKKDGEPKIKFSGVPEKLAKSERQNIEGAFYSIANLVLGLPLSEYVDAYTVKVEPVDNGYVMLAVAKNPDSQITKASMRINKQWHITKNELVQGGVALTQEFVYADLGKGLMLKKMRTDVGGSFMIVEPKFELVKGVFLPKTITLSEVDKNEKPKITPQIFALTDYKVVTAGK
ncbi:hypothetical protein ACFL1X_11470 [Candidatus Hydrogenedentota bacterium]